MYVCIACHLRATVMVEQRNLYLLEYWKGGKMEEGRKYEQGFTKQRLSKQI